MKITGTFLDEITHEIHEPIETAAGGAEKLIAFEFSHFMSPHSLWPSAHNLYRRYQEYIRKES